MNCWYCNWLNYECESEECRDVLAEMEIAEAVKREQESQLDIFEGNDDGQRTKD